MSQVDQGVEYAKELKEKIIINVKRKLLLIISDEPYGTYFDNETFLSFLLWGLLVSTTRSLSIAYGVQVGNSVLENLLNRNLLPVFNFLLIPIITTVLANKRSIIKDFVTRVVICLTLSSINGFLHGYFYSKSLIDQPADFFMPMIGSIILFLFVPTQSDHRLRFAIICGLVPGVVSIYLAAAAGILCVSYIFGTVLSCFGAEFSAQCAIDKFTKKGEPMESDEFFASVILCTMVNEVLGSLAVLT